MSDDTLGTSIYLVYISIGFQTSRLAIFSFIWHQWVSRTWARACKRAAAAAEAAAAAVVSCFGSCLIAAARQQHHSSSSHQQQHQQQAAGRRRQQQAAASISRQQQTQADAAAVRATAAVQQLAARKICGFQGWHQWLAASASSSQQPVASSLPKISRFF